MFPFKTTVHYYELLFISRNPDMRETLLQFLCRLADLSYVETQQESENISYRLFYVDSSGVFEKKLGMPSEYTHKKTLKELTFISSLSFQIAKIRSVPKNEIFSNLPCNSKTKSAMKNLIVKVAVSRKQQMQRSLLKRQICPAKRDIF